MAAFGRFIPYRRRVFPVPNFPAVPEKPVFYTKCLRKCVAMTVIDDKDLLLSPQSVKNFFIDCNVPYKEDELPMLVEFSRGHGMTVKMVADLLKQGVSNCKELMHRVQELFWDYLEHYF